MRKLNRPRYSYAVVTSNGAGVHGTYKRCDIARQAMSVIARNRPFLAPFEIERIRHLPGGSRQYQVREGSRWVEWDAARDPDVRKPDWFIGVRE